MRLHASFAVAKPPTRRATRLDAWCLAALADAFHGAAVRIQLWDGTARDLSEDPPVATLKIHDRATLVRMLRQPALAFGEAYSAGRLEVDGSLVRFLEAANRATAHLYFTNPVKPWEERAKQFVSTHPPIVDRINRLRQLSGEPPLQESEVAGLAGLD